jgi:cytochrome c oxidase subunit 2
VTGAGRIQEIVANLRVGSGLLRVAALCLLVVASSARGYGAERSFDVTASRFEFNPATIEVEEGDHVVLHLKSGDTTHGFSIKEYKIKQAIPKTGEVVTVEFDAAKAGTFVFGCSEYCGSGHSRMKGKLVVSPKTRKESKL